MYAFPGYETPIMLDELAQKIDALILGYQCLQQDNNKLTEQCSQLVDANQQLEKKHALAGDKIKQLMANLRKCE